MDEHLLDRVEPYGNQLFEEKRKMTILNAAIYHFTNSKDKHPAVCAKQLEQLKDFAYSKGFIVTEIFCDKSLLRCEHPEFNRFMSCYTQFDVLIVKDFYHLSKNTAKCMEIMTELRNNGIEIYTLENGQFTWEDTPFNEPLKIATYSCHFGPPNERKESLQLKKDILTLFTDKKTNWILCDQYFDESKYQKDGEQVQLMNLMQNKDNYDLLLVHDLNDVHWRTANFCKIREQLQMDIYSLQDGFLKYERSNQ